MTGFPIKKKIKVKSSLEQIRVGLQTLSNSLDSVFCPYIEDYLNNVNIDSTNIIESYDGQLNSLHIYQNKLMELLNVILKHFYPQDTNIATLLYNEYSSFISNYPASIQPPRIHNLFKKDPVLTYYLILIIRKGCILLTQLGIVAFLELAKDIMNDPNLPSTLLPSFKKYVETPITLPKLTEKLIHTLNVIMKKKLLDPTSSLMLFVKEKIVCAYLYKILKQINAKMTFNCIYEKKGASIVIL